MTPSLPLVKFDSALRSLTIPRFKLSILTCALTLTLSISALPAPPPQQSSNSKGGGVSVEKSPQLFSVLSALYTAGYEAEGSNDAGPEVVALQQRLRALQGPAIDELKAYYHDHELGTPGETASRYISYALLVGPPPKFLFQEDEAMLPSDVLSLDNFGAVLVKFVQAAQIGREWQRIAPVYDVQVDRYRGPVYKSTLVASSYLRELTKSSSASSFTVYVEPLAGTRANFRTSADHYSIVVGSARELPIDQIRHAYIHFLIDPLVVQYGDEIDKKHDLMNIAGRAPQLPREYQGDFTSLFDECMVKAVELRLTRMSAADLDAALAKFDQQGMILVRPIVDQLKLFEKDQPAMRYYFPDLVKAINVDTETQRLKNVTFAPPAPPSETPQPAADKQNDKPIDEHALGRSPKHPGQGTAPSQASGDAASAQPSTPLNELDQNILAAQQQLATGHPDAAESMFEALLDTHPHEPRIEFELAMVAIVRKDPDKAEGFLRRIVRHSPTGDGIQPDAKTLAWAHVYLGRIYDLQENRDDAVAEYSAALKVDGAPDPARRAAEAGRKTPYGGSGGDSGSGPGSSENQRP